jgi:hypothetical protein
MKSRAITVTIASAQPRNVVPFGVFLREHKDFGAGTENAALFVKSGNVEMIFYF